jgi:hypothetical protein
MVAHVVALVDIFDDCSDDADDDDYAGEDGERDLSGE